MAITIYQGNDLKLEPSDVTVVIDVIRAFTVAHLAFIKGARRILLVRDIEDAFLLKKLNPDFLLVGEVNGLPIEGFDLDNSPARLDRFTGLEGMTLIQKTTNGVKATLNSLQSSHLFVTGYTNARATGLFVKGLIQQPNRNLNVNIIASHPTGDDDLACAEYIKALIEGNESISEEDVINRILQSHVTAKFFDPMQPEFNHNDLNYCIQEIPGDFVMKVNMEECIPMIERLKI